MENKKHYGIFNSTVFDEADAKGVITTTSCPQTFKFTNPEKTIGYVVDVIEIERDPFSAVTDGEDDTLKIQYNDDISYVCVEAGVTEIQSSINIKKITVLSPIGSRFKFKGLISDKYKI